MFSSALQIGGFCICEGQQKIRREFFAISADGLIENFRLDAADFCEVGVEDHAFTTDRKSRAHSVITSPFSSTIRIIAMGADAEGFSHSTVSTSDRVLPCTSKRSRPRIESSCP